MTLLTPSHTRRIIAQRRRSIPTTGRLGATRELLKEARTASNATFDIFLSHSSEDASDVLRIKAFLQALEYSVYVDWIEDGDLDRARVDPTRADLLRRRIGRSRCLLLYATGNARGSRWTPWELGYADGFGKRVGLLPEVSEDAVPGEFPGVEYYGLYPYVAPTADANTREEFLAVTRSGQSVSLDSWLDTGGRKP